MGNARPPWNCPVVLFLLTIPRELRYFIFENAIANPDTQEIMIVGSTDLYNTCRRLRIEVVDTEGWLRKKGHRYYIGALASRDLGKPRRWGGWR